MSRRALLPPIVPAAPKRRLPTRGRHLLPISATDLLSRAPIEACNCRARGSRRCNLPFEPRPSTRTLVRASERHSPHRCRIATGASPASTDAVVGCHRHPPCPSPALPVRAARCPTWTRTLTCARFVRPHASRVAWTRTLPVTPPLHAGAYSDLVEPRRGPFPQAAHQCRRFPGPERLPPMSPSDHAPLLALERMIFEPPLVPRFCRLGPASHTRSRTRLLRARPDRLAGYSPELTGHVKPIDFCNCQESRAQPRVSETSPHVVRRPSAARESGCALASAHQPGFTAQGLRFPRGALQPPHRRPHADADLPQPDRPAHLLSRSDDRKQPGIGLRDRPGGRAGDEPELACFPAPPSPFSSGLAPPRRATRRTDRLALAALRRSAGSPLGPPSTPARESGDGQPHPRCLPPLQPTSYPWARCAPRRGVPAR